MQANTSDPAIEQVEVGVYKGIASEVLTDDKPDNDPEALCAITVDTNSACTISEVSEQGTYTLMVKQQMVNQTHNFRALSLKSST